MTKRKCPENSKLKSNFPIKSFPSIYNLAMNFV